MQHVQILCEGPTCNSGGISARDRETAMLKSLPSATEEMRVESAKYARSAVSRALVLRPHAGPTRIAAHGMLMFACESCGHERVYGNTFWTAG